MIHFLRIFRHVALNATGQLRHRLAVLAKAKPAAEYPRSAAGAAGRAVDPGRASRRPRSAGTPRSATRPAVRAVIAVSPRALLLRPFLPQAVPGPGSGNQPNDRRKAEHENPAGQKLLREQLRL